MNIDTANAIRDRIRLSPTEIRVLCPRGHFIAHIALYVSDEGQTDPSLSPLMMHPRGPDKQYGGNMSAGRHGFQIVSHPQSFNVRLVCTNRRCTYSGKFGFVPLAVELAAAALAGHSEHRMTV